MFWDTVKSMWYVDFAGHRRYMGRQAITPDQRKSYGIRQAAVNLIPESAWTEQDFRSFAPPVKDQHGEGACVAFGSTTVHQTSRAMQGMTFAALSCGNLYGQINGQSDNGAIVEQALTSLEQTGQCLNTTIDDMTWQSRRWPTGWAAEAARFRVEIGGHVSTFEEICSLLEIGQLVAIGIDCGRDFYPGSDGMLPRQSGSGGGHCLACLGKKKVGSEWRLIIRNSWTTAFGDNGDCYMERSYIDSSGGGHYNVIASRDDPSDPNNPPVTK